MNRTKKKMSGKEKKRQKRVTKVYFIIAYLLLLSLVILLLYNFGVFDKKKDAEYFSIEDECFPIFDQMVHNLKNEGDCKIKCENNCEFRDMEFLNSSFVPFNSSALNLSAENQNLSFEDFCHTCDCYCN